MVHTGAGHQLGDWRRTASTHIRRASPQAAALIRAWFLTAENSPFITT